MSDGQGGILRWIRRCIVFVIGATVTLFGVILFFTPGPAIVVVPLGLMILATEFAWARVILARVKERLARLRPGSREPGAPPQPPPADSGAGRPPDQP